MAGERKVFSIPNTDYIDGPPEVAGAIPVDDFIVFVGLMIVVLLNNFPTLALPIAVACTFGYRRFKTKYSKNFYLTIPYRIGINRPKGVPPITVREFRE